VQGVLSAKVKNYKKHVLVSISILVPLGATNGFVHNFIGQSVEQYSETVPYPYRNVLQVEYVFCLAKAARKFKACASSDL
jgi:hypothetical protein